MPVTPTELALAVEQKFFARLQLGITANMTRFQQHVGPELADRVVGWKFEPLEGSHSFNLVLPNLEPPIHLSPLKQQHSSNSGAGDATCPFPRSSRSFGAAGAGLNKRGEVLNL